jgi:hypothetical protein
LSARAGGLPEIPPKRGETILVSFTRTVVLEVDLAAARIWVDPPERLLDREMNLPVRDRSLRQVKFDWQTSASPSDVVLWLHSPVLLALMETPICVKLVVAGRALGGINEAKSARLNLPGQIIERQNPTGR